MEQNWKATDTIHTDQVARASVLPSLGVGMPPSWAMATVAARLPMVSSWFSMRRSRTKTPSICGGGAAVARGMDGVEVGVGVS